ncbi:MAG: ribonuclease T [Pseudomonadota bacterium]
MEFKQRFRGYLPVVIDLETGGFDATTHPILELSAVLLDWQGDQLRIKSQHDWAVAPFAGSTVEPASLKITGIDPDDPQRAAVDERTALMECFALIRSEIKTYRCNRAILVAHNASFDQGFLKAAVERGTIKRDPFHPFSTIDTAALAALCYGHTVLSEACRRAGLTFDNQQAHSAHYDTKATAELFCLMVNNTPLPVVPEVAASA